MIQNIIRSGITDLTLKSYFFHEVPIQETCIYQGDIKDLVILTLYQEAHFLARKDLSFCLYRLVTIQTFHLYQTGNCSTSLEPNEALNEFKRTVKMNTLELNKFIIYVEYTCSIDHQSQLWFKRARRLVTIHKRNFSQAEIALSLTFK